MTPQQKKVVTLGVIINTLILFLGSIALLKSPVVRDDEKTLIKTTVDWKKMLLKDTALKDSFLFVNISYEKELVEREWLEDLDAKLDEKVKETPTQSVNEDDMNLDEFLENTEGLMDSMVQQSECLGDYPIDNVKGNKVITSRKTLAAFFSFLNKHPDAYRYVLCDVLFDGESPNDDLLLKELRRMKNLIVPYVEEDDKIVKAFFKTGDQDLKNIETGLVDFKGVDGAFVKYNLTLDDETSLPVKLYEELGGEKLKPGGLFDKMGDKPVFNNFIVNLRVVNDTNFYKAPNYWNILGAALCLDANEEEVLKMIRNRIIVIGDFKDEKNDFHETALGPMPGPLLLTNIYLALKYGDNRVNYLLFVILLVGFAIVSYLLFNPEDKLKKWLEEAEERIEEKEKELRADLNNKPALKKLERRAKLITRLKGKTVAYATELISYLAIFYAISVLAYLLLNNHINIFWLTVYVFSLEKLVNRMYIKWGWREPDEETEAS